MFERSTTPDVVELTRPMFDVPAGAWSLDETVDTFTRFFAPDVVWDSAGLGTTFEGLAAVRELMGDWLARFEDYAVDVEEILDLGNGVVFAKSSHSGRLAGSPVHLRLPREVLVHVLVWEQGMITRVVSSGDTAAARAAAKRLAEEKGARSRGATPSARRPAAPDG